MDVKRFRWVQLVSITVAAVAIASLYGAQARAQDLEPRAYSAAPVGTNFLIVDYSHSSGNSGVDPSFPIQDLHATIDVVKLGYSHTFDLAGRMASYAMLLPAARGFISGIVSTQNTQVTRSGHGDFGVRVVVNLKGCPALTPAQFARRKPTTVVGASLIVIAPTGAYDSAHFFNVGTNRWSLRPEVGVEQPMGKWFVDGATGVWLYTVNHDFFHGNVLSQNPIPELQVHTGYNFRPGQWLAADANYYGGGKTSLNGTPTSVTFANSRYGLTFAQPFGQGFAAKLAWSKWLGGTFRNKYNTFELALQYRWFDR